MVLTTEAETDVNAPIDEWGIYLLRHFPFALLDKASMYHARGPCALQTALTCLVGAPRHAAEPRTQPCPLSLLA